MTVRKGITLDEFTILREKDHPGATGELSKLLRDIGMAAKIINREVNKAGLVDDILGAHGSENSHGEAVQKLDMYANEQLHYFLKGGGQCCGIASEEEEHYVVIDSPQSANAKYIVMFDPLDGSSNIDVNVSIGTIFSIYKRSSDASGACTLDDFLQPGTEQIAAGYVIYGSSSMLVYTTGNGVNGFTLDPSIGEFCLSHPDIKTPEDGKVYSLNQGNYKDFTPGVQAYIDYCQGLTGELSKPYSLRYIGSMVADFHRNLIKGGIFIYPTTSSAPNGKLRLLYECNPLSFVVEQAGGMSTNGQQRIMELKPGELHQRVPIMIGSKNMVEKATQIIHQQSENLAQ